MRFLLTTNTRWLLAAAAAAGALAALVLLWPTRSTQQASESGSPPAAGRSAAAYVGVDRCAECHLEQADKFAASGHARTFRLTASDEFAFLDDRRYVDSDYALMFHYLHGGEGLFARLPQVFPDREFPLPYALGSGTHAVTFLTLLPNQHGETVGIEHRVSVFGDGSLARTPGAPAGEPRQPTEYFGKLTEGERLHDCVACHTTTAELVDFEVRNLRPHVQCERCHGPGSEHVAAMEVGQPDTSLRFAPGRATAREEIEMCGRCHRLPQMLTDTRLERSNPTIARYQPVGMLQSPCYLKSDGRLRCTTCHDPHERADLRSRGEYSQTCLTCHQDFHVASCPQSAATPRDCIGCHMPPVEVHPGIAFHDHWIRVRNASDPAPARPLPGADGVGTDSGDQ